MNEKARGFTLIELLIVIGIVAILAAIAIPQFAVYRARAFNAAADSDLSNIRLTEEAMFGELADFGGSVVVTGTITLVGATSNTSQNVVLSSGVYAGAKVLEQSGRNVSYTGATKHLKGDVCYGTEPETQGLNRLSKQQGLALLDADIPNATASVDFIDPWSPIN